MQFKGYRKFIGRVLARTRRKAEKVKRRMNDLGYVALMFLVAVPVPGTGAWTGTMVAWVMGLDRLKSYVAIGIGVIIAGFLVLLASLGFFSGIY